MGIWNLVRIPPFNGHWITIISQFWSFFGQGKSSTTFLKPLTTRCSICTEVRGTISYLQECLWRYYTIRPDIISLNGASQGPILLINNVWSTRRLLFNTRIMLVDPFIDVLKASALLKRLDRTQLIISGIGIISEYN